MSGEENQKLKLEDGSLVIEANLAENEVITRCSHCANCIKTTVIANTDIPSRTICHTCKMQLHHSARRQ